MEQKKRSIITVVFGFFFRIIRFPLDILFVTYDGIKATLWWVWIAIRRLSAMPDGPPWGPFSCGTTVTQEECFSACPRVRKYGTRSLFRLVCPYTTVEANEEGKFLCASPGAHYRITFLRSISTGICLILVWGVIGVGTIKVALYLRGNRVVTPAATVSPQEMKATSERFLASADKYFNEKDYRNALLEYRNAVKYNPDNAKAHAGAGECYLNLRSFQEAESAFFKVIGLDPRSARAHLVLAQIALSRKQFEQAMTHAKRALKLTPDDPEIYLLMGACHQALSQHDLALDQIDKAIASDNATSDILLIAAGLYLKEQKPDRAEQCYRRILDLDGTRNEVRIELAKVLRQLKKVEAAKHELTMVLDKDPFSNPARAEMAELYVSEKDVEGAIELYKKVIAKDLKDYNARARLAELLFGLGRSEEGYRVAEDLLLENPDHAAGNMVMANLFLEKNLYALAIKHGIKANKGDPNNAWAHKILSKAYLATEEFVKAVDHAKAGLKTTPDDLELQLALGAGHKKLAQTKEALAVFEKAAKDHPTSPLPHLYLGQLFADQLDIPAAIDRFEEALHLAPNSPVAMNNLANLLLESGKDLDRAYMLSNQLRVRFPANPFFADTFGCASLLRGDLNQAQLSLFFAAQKLPQNPSVRFHLGLLHYKMGNLEEALQELDAAVEISKTFIGADRAHNLITELRKRIPSSKKTPKDNRTPVHVPKAPSDSLAKGDFSRQ